MPGQPLAALQQCGPVGLDREQVVRVLDGDQELRSLPGRVREAATRQALAASSLPVATATPDPDQTPAGPLWLPLHTSGPRRRLAQLASAW
jgi:hypothetical protein